VALDCRVDPEAVPLDSEPDDGVMALAGITFELLLARAGDEYEEAIESLTPGQTALLVLSWAQGQIDNGGMWQLLGNSTGRWYEDFVALAQLVGAEEHAELFADLRVALGVDTLPIDMEERDDFLDSIAESGEATAVDPLDDRFYALNSDRSRSLDHRLWEYVRTHAREFLLTPDEAAADEELLIAALREAAREVRSRVGLASLDAVAAAEERLGLPLPRLVRRLYSEVGNGGWGPDDGLVPLDVALAIHARGDVPRGWLPLFERGDSGWRIADLRSPAIALARFDPSRPRLVGATPLDPVPVDDSLRSLMQMWLAGREIY
jgi:hypothetical protein